MAQRHVTSEHEMEQEQQVLTRLLQLYSEERRIYREILNLSRRQGEVVRQGDGLQTMQEVLALKKSHLDAIARLERQDQPARDAWRVNRNLWSSEASAKLHDALQEVGTLIEEILLSEEDNDRLLLEVTGLA